MAARSGGQYLEGLRDDRRVWYGGERVQDVTAHPAFAPRAQAIARLYDLQQEPTHRDRLTFASPKTGEPVGLSFLMPRSVAHLEERRAMVDVWAETSSGLLGQTPDDMNIGLMSLAAAHEFFAQVDPRFGIHILRYYEMCREEDRCLVRGVSLRGAGSVSASTATADGEMSLRAVAQRSEGLVVHGVCKLTRLAPLADDVVICAGPPLRPGEGPCALLCAIPVTTPGLSLICRETVERLGNTFDHPLATRFEEMDCMALFEDVLVPWEQVFLYANVDAYNRFETATHFTWQVGHQVIARQVAKTALLLGTMHLLSEATGIAGFLHVQDRLGEMVTYLETLRACLRRAEMDAIPFGGVLYPQGDAVHAALRLFPTFYPRMIEMMQILGAGRYLMTLGESDWPTPEAGAMARYGRGASISAPDRIRLFRLAWDIVGDSFGMQQQLYEQYFSGDSASLMAARYLDYDKTSVVKCVQTLLKTSHIE